MKSVGEVERVLGKLDVLTTTALAILIAGQAGEPARLTAHHSIQ
jgi:hypothetical protein